MSHVEQPEKHPLCAKCDQPLLPDQPRASRVGIGGYYHEACWSDEDAAESDCSWCGGEGWQDSNDQLWDDDDTVPCSACAGTGMRRHQSIF